MSSHLKGMARQFLHGHREETTEFFMDIHTLCCSCGGPQIDPQKTSKVLKSSFTTINAFMLFPGDLICKYCQELLEKRELRFKTIICKSPGNVEVIERQEVLDKLRNPPKEFVISIAYSFKKHHWLHAGLSNRERILIGTDDKMVEFVPKEHTQILNAIETMKSHGVSSREIEAGHYHPATYEKVGGVFLEQINNILQPHRPTGLVELLVKIVPSKEKKEIIKREVIEMIENIDKEAAEYLSLLAQHSQYRRERGKEFWDGFFLYRINRVSRLNLPEMTDKLMGMLDIPATSAGEHIIPVLNSFDLEKQKEIETTIREKSKLIVALCYQILKERRETK